MLNIKKIIVVTLLSSVAAFSFAQPPAASKNGGTYAVKTHTAAVKPMHHKSKHPAKKHAIKHAKKHHKVVRHQANKHPKAQVAQKVNSKGPGLEAY